MLRLFYSLSGVKSLEEAVRKDICYFWLKWVGLNALGPARGKLAKEDKKDIDTSRKRNFHQTQNLIRGYGTVINMK